MQRTNVPYRAAGDSADRSLLHKTIDSNAELPLFAFTYPSAMSANSPGRSNSAVPLRVGLYPPESKVNRVGRGFTSKMQQGRMKCQI